MSFSSHFAYLLNELGEIPVMKYPCNADERVRILWKWVQLEPFYTYERNWYPLFFAYLRWFCISTLAMHAFWYVLTSVDCVCDIMIMVSHSLSCTD